MYVRYIRGSLNGIAIALIRIIFPLLAVSAASNFSVSTRGDPVQTRPSPMPRGIPLYHKTPRMNHFKPIKNWKNNNKHNNRHIAFFDACFDDRKCIFQVSPEYFLDLNVVHLPRTKHPRHPGPTTRPQPHGTLKSLPDDNRPTKQRGHAFVWLPYGGGWIGLNCWQTQIEFCHAR
jgi:hypothetical protein